jgi:hypothetical protein
MKSIDPLGMPWDEYLVLHFREIAAALLLIVVLLCILLFVELPGATTLTGRVTSQGKPVVFGTVTVITSDQRTHSVPIKPDGTYMLKGVPRGPVKVAISSPNPQPVVERQAVESGAVGGGTRSQSARPKSASGGSMSSRPLARGKPRPSRGCPSRRRMNGDRRPPIPARVMQPIGAGSGFLVATPTPPPPASVRTSGVDGQP